MSAVKVSLSSDFLLLSTNHVQDTPYSESLRAAADMAPLFDSLRIGGREVGAPGRTLTPTLTPTPTVTLTLAQA